jgi:hypothetical protein
MRWMETLQEYGYEIVYVQGKFTVVADAQSRISESPLSELYTVEDEEEAAEPVALKVVGTVSRSMLTKSMLSEVLRAYKEDKILERTSKIRRMINLRNQLIEYCMQWITRNESWLCRRESYDKPHCTKRIVRWYRGTLGSIRRTSV